MCAKESQVPFCKLLLFFLMPWTSQSSHFLNLGAKRCNTSPCSMPLPLLFGSKWRILPPPILLICFIQQYFFISFVVYNTFRHPVFSSPGVFRDKVCCVTSLGVFLSKKRRKRGGRCRHGDSWTQKVIREHKKVIHEHKKVIHERKRWFMSAKGWFMSAK